jgi:hypothetical protein
MSIRNNQPVRRREFFKTAVQTGAALGFAELGFLSLLPPVSAAEAKLDMKRVQFSDEIEPLVRFIEDTPREKLLEETGARIRRGLAYRDLLAALFLAGIRDIQPRPVGFKFHSVLVVNSAHLASVASPDSERWLPIFWALDYFKVAQEQDRNEGDWTMGPPPESSALPPPDRARDAFIAAMDNWDEQAADAAVIALARSADRRETFNLFCRFGARDFRDIGHKAIYVANSWRTLDVIGWQHAEPVLRSLAYALLERGDANVNPAKSDLGPDRPWRSNLPLIAKFPASWLSGDVRAGATAEMLGTLRTSSAGDAASQAVALLNAGVAPQSIWDSLFVGAGELLMRSPGIIALHAVTSTNALHYAWNHCSNEDTRKMLLLQNASFLPLFRGEPKAGGVRIDEIEPTAPAAGGERAVDEIFSDIGRDRLTAARKLLAWLGQKTDPKDFTDTARRLVFTKGTNAHDYKFSAAVLENYSQLTPPWRDRFLAASVFNLRASTAPDSELVKRTRAALAG